MSAGWRWAARVVLTGYAVGLVTVLAWPDGAAIRRVNIGVYGWFLSHGAPLWLKPGFYEFSLNALVVAPLAAMLVIAFPQIPRWVWVGLGLVGSAGVEWFQAAQLPGRNGSIVDVAANTMGALLGVLLGSVMARRSQDSPSAR